MGLGALGATLTTLLKSGLVTPIPQKSLLGARFGASSGQSADELPKEYYFGSHLLGNLSCLIYF